VILRILTLDKDNIFKNLKELAERCYRNGIDAEMVIFGGAALALAYGSRRITHDIDDAAEINPPG
jgi:hypothetical protein